MPRASLNKSNAAARRVSVMLASSELPALSAVATAAPTRDAETPAVAVTSLEATA